MVLKKTAENTMVRDNDDEEERWDAAKYNCEKKTWHGWLFVAT